VCRGNADQTQHPDAEGAEVTQKTQKNFDEVSFAISAQLLRLRVQLLVVPPSSHGREFVAEKFRSTPHGRVPIRILLRNKL
jgi:hypothetical protein